MKQLFFVIFLFHGFFLHAQDTVLLTINDSVKVTKDEFVRTYKKNSNNGLQTEQKSKKEYLELFINYKLKVQEAVAQKLDTVSKFKKEFEGYVKQLSEPYLVDTSVDNHIVLQAYERMKEEIRSSHILVLISEKSTPADTLAAYMKAISLRERIMKGESFDSVAKYNSDDPSAKSNFGDIGYMSVFNTVYNYENVMYTQKVGEVSMPTRSNFGYHLVKVTDRRPAPGEIRMSHVLINSRYKDTVQQVLAKQRIDSAYANLQRGVPFATVAMTYSEDPRTKNHGGDYQGWISMKQRFPKEFKDIAFKLKLDEYSKPFETEFGWHIVKITDKRLCSAFDVESPGLKNIIKNDPIRNTRGTIAIIEKLKKSYNYTTNLKNIELFISKTDSSILNKEWVAPSTLSAKNALFSFAGKSFTEVDFSNWLSQNLPAEKKKVDISKGTLLSSLINSYSNFCIIDYERSVLNVKYPEYKYLVQEYHDGMLLFDLTDQIIWSVTTKNDAGLKQYFSDNQSKFTWGERVDLYTYTCKNQKDCDKLFKILSAKTPSKTDSQLLTEFNKKDSSALVVKNIKLDKASIEIPQGITFAKGSIVKKNNEIFYVRSVIEPQPKLLTECRGQVIADFQKHLEEQWISSLRAKYSVKVDEKVFNSIQE